jgi:acyl-coenzyme A thioesterase PaaI-like protein
VSGRLGQLVAAGTLPVASPAVPEPGTPMTDFLDESFSIPARLGVVAELSDGEFRLALHPRPQLLHHGALRASVIAFMIDVVAGVVLDDDPDAWMLTSDMSVRMRPLRAPSFLSTRSTILRRGRRSATAKVDLVSETGAPVATGAIGFARVQRRTTDPVKPQASPERISMMFDGSRTLDRPLREEAGIVVLDPMAGSLEMQVTPELRNPAGTLQGAMVALFAEAAAEELASARFNRKAVVTELDLRYLAQTGAGPVQSECTLLGDGPDAPIQVELSDRSSGRLTTLVYARTAVIPT